jgi:hypothetical protein
LKNDTLYLSIEDEFEANYMKILDFKKKEQDFYFDLNRYLISGDKLYLWDL